MRQHRAAHTVTNCPDTGGGGSRFLIHLNLSLFRQLYTGIIRQKTIGKRLAPDADQQDIESQLAFTVLVFHRNRNLTVLDLCALDQGSQADVQALLFEFTCGLFAHVLVSDRQEIGQGFEQDDFRAKPVPYGTQLQADDAGANDAEAGGNGSEIQRTYVVHDVFTVKLDIGDLDGNGAGCEDDIIGIEGQWFTAIDRSDLYLPSGFQFALALVVSNLVAFEQLTYAAGQLFHNIVFACHHQRHIHGSILNTDSVGAVVMLQMIKKFAGIQQGLRWDAAHVQAGTAGGRLAVLAGKQVDTSRFQTQLRGPDCCHVAAGTGANYDYIKFFCHDFSPIPSIIFGIAATACRLNIGAPFNIGH